MNSVLRNRLIAAGAGGVLAIAATLGAWHEGEGPIERIDGVVWNVSYQDTGKVWTVCRGLTGPVAGPGKKYTADQCRTMEEQRYAVTENQTRRQLTHYDGYSKWRKAALVDFVWNLGEGALAGSTMRSKFNAGDEVGGCRELAKWVKSRVKGILVTLKGLVSRRDDELDLCLNWNAP